MRLVSQTITLRKTLGYACVLTVFLLTTLTICTFSSGSTNPLQLTQLNLDLPAAAQQAPVTGQLPGDTKLNVRVTFKLNQSTMQQAQQQGVQPDKPSKAEQWANKLGISDDTYQKIKNFFNLGGVELNLSKLRTHLSVTAKASTLAKILHTQFVERSYQDRTFYSPDPKKPPQVPQFLADSIDAVTGLDNFSSKPTHDFTFQPFESQSSTRQSRSAQDCSPQDQTLFPKDVAHAYGFDQMWNNGLHGENMTVNLVEIDGALKDDVQNYFDCINFQGHLNVVNVDGAPQETLGESTLDIEMIAVLARSSNISVYQTNASNQNSDIWSQVNDELQQILNDNANKTTGGGVVSISLGAGEGEVSGANMKAIDSSIRQLVEVEHLMVFVASGDCGAFTTGKYGQLAVSYPASDPYAISVGGTILQIDQNQNRAKEVVWSDGSNSGSCKNQWGSGGGNSTKFKRPSWQDASGVNNKYSKNMRQLPDVSAVAYGLAVYYQGQWGAVGGTSAAAPIWATALALIHQGMIKEKKSFNASPETLYKIAKQSRGARPYQDITQGDNLYYPATSGWDYATGLGTPNVQEIYKAMKG